MAIGKLYYSALGTEEQAAESLRPQLYYIWGIIRSSKKNTMSRLELEKVLLESNITNKKDFKNFVDHAIHMLNKKKLITKMRLVD